MGNLRLNLPAMQACVAGGCRGFRLRLEAATILSQASVNNERYFFSGLAVGAAAGAAPFAGAAAAAPFAAAAGA